MVQDISFSRNRREFESTWGWPPSGGRPLVKLQILLCYKESTITTTLYSIFYRPDFANYIDFSDDSRPKKLSYTSFDSYVFNKIEFSRKSINLFHGSDNSGKILSSMDLLIGLLVNKGRKNFGGISSPRGAFYVLYWLMLVPKRRISTLLRLNIPLTKTNTISRKFIL